VLRKRKAAAVSLHQLAQAGDDGGVVGQYQRVARLVETFVRKVQRRDERGTIVRHQILGVVLHDRVGVRVHRRAGLFEPAPQLRELFLSALGARGHEQLNGNAATYRRRELHKDFVVVAAEKREGDAPLGFADDVEHGSAPLVDRNDQPISWNRGRDRGHHASRGKGPRSPYPLSCLDVTGSAVTLHQGRGARARMKDASSTGALHDYALDAFIGSRPLALRFSALAMFTAACAGGTGSTPGGPSEPPPTTPQTVTLLGAGDIADCTNDGGSHARDTGRMMDSIASDAIFTAGDNAY